MSSLNVHSNNPMIEVLAPAAQTATANGAAVDMQTYIGQVKFILSSTAGTGTTPTLDVKLQDSANGTTGWADITGAAFTQVTDAADANEAIGVAIDGAERYVRAVVTISGTTPSFTCGVVAVGAKQYA